MPTLYHRTNTDRAESILHDGFRYNQSHGFEVEGVWLSSFPLDGNSGAAAYEGGEDAALIAVELDLSREELFAREVLELGKPYREFVLPASLIRERGRLRRVSKEEEEQIGVDIPIWNDYPVGEPMNAIMELLADTATDEDALQSLMEELRTRRMMVNEET
jgi:hypothetical protein